MGYMQQWWAAARPSETRRLYAAANLNLKRLSTGGLGSRPEDLSLRGAERRAEREALREIERRERRELREQLRSARRELRQVEPYWRVLLARHTAGTLGTAPGEDHAALEELDHQREVLVESVNEMSTRLAELQYQCPQVRAQRYRSR